MSREQQEKVAEEMLGLTRRLKEQSLVARTIVQAPSHVLRIRVHFLRIRIQDFFPIHFFKGNNKNVKVPVFY